MASTESLEALGRDYAINFGSQTVSSNREQPADPPQGAQAMKVDDRPLVLRLREAMPKPPPGLTGWGRYRNECADFVHNLRAALGPAPLVFPSEPPSPSVHQGESDGEAVQRPVDGKQELTK